MNPMTKPKKHNRYHLLLSDKLDAILKREAEARAVEPNDLIRSILSVALTGKETPAARSKVRDIIKSDLVISDEHRATPYIPPSIKKSR